MCLGILILTGHHHSKVTTGQNPQKQRMYRGGIPVDTTHIQSSKGFKKYAEEIQLKLQGLEQGVAPLSFFCGQSVRVMSNYFNSLRQQDPAEFESPATERDDVKSFIFTEELQPNPSSFASSSWDQTRHVLLDPRKQGQTYFRKSHGKSSNK